MVIKKSELAIKSYKQGLKPFKSEKKTWILKSRASKPLNLKM